MHIPNKVFLIFLLIIIPFIYLSADERVAIMDFQIESANDSYQSLGKGFAEFVSVELSGTPGLTLVDREKRNAALEEMKFGLSGLADGKSVAEIGNLLSVNYLISGMIIDIDGFLIVTCELMAVETGEIIVHEKADGKISDYDRITKTLARAVISGLDLKEETVVAAVKEDLKKPTEEEAEIVLVSFSQAVDAYDAGDTETAKEKLEVAASLDEGNKAVKVFLNKLYINTSKFRVVPAAYFTNSNPASLGFIMKDTLSFNIAIAGNRPFYTDESGYELDGLYGPLGTTRYVVRELDAPVFIRYQFPIGKSTGVGVELFFAHIDSQSCPLGGYDELVTTYGANGGILSFGWTPVEWLSLGISATAAYYGKNSGREGAEPPPGSPLLLAGTMGFILKNGPGSLIYSLNTGFSNFESHEIDLVAETIGDKVAWPFYLDQSVTFGFNNMRSFAVLKHIMEIYLYDAETGKIAMFDNGSQTPYMQFIPVFEHWISSSFSLRGGPVVSTNLENTGFGAVLGSTVTFNKTKELDIGITYRLRPSRIIGEELIPELVISVGYSMSDLWIKR